MSSPTPSMLPDAGHLPVVLVLASGRGERFLASGGTTHKLQADLCGATVLQRTLDAVRASGLRWHLEDAGHPGMGDSIAAAVRATRGAMGGWMVLPADLPLVQPNTLVTIARAPLDGEVLVPWFQGQRGHPVRFAASCGDALASLEGNQGAAPVVSARTAIKIVVDDAGCVLDIDTLADLERARAAWRQSR
nr:NTP transferase domain-containing protein [uncultured Rhodoferax sp.]